MKRAHQNAPVLVVESISLTILAASLVMTVSSPDLALLQKSPFARSVTMMASKGSTSVSGLAMR